MHEIFAGFCKFKHAQSSLDIYTERIVQPRVKIDRSCRIYDDMYVFSDLLKAFWTQIQTFFQLMKNYIEKKPVSYKVSLDRDNFRIDKIHKIAVVFPNFIETRWGDDLFLESLHC